jgi:hypothetical protein
MEMGAGVAEAAAAAAAADAHRRDAAAPGCVSAARTHPASAEASGSGGMLERREQLRTKSVWHSIAASGVRPPA